MEVHRKQTSAEVTAGASRVTRIAVAKRVWMVGDSANNTLDRHDHHDNLLAAEVVPIALCNARSTDDLKHIEYRVEDRITDHSEDVQLKQSTLDETYNRRTGVERINGSVMDCGLGRTHARGRSRMSESIASLCAFVWSSQSPTTNAETIQGVP